MRLLIDTEAQRIAETVVKSDPAILGLVVMDERGGIVAGAPVSGMESSQRQMGEELQQMSAGAVVVLRSGARAVRFLGKLNYIAYSYETTKILAFGIPHQRYTVAISLTPRARSPSVYKKVLSALMAK